MKRSLGWFIILGMLILSFNMACSDSSDSPQSGLLVFQSFAFTDTDIETVLDVEAKTVEASASFAKDTTKLVAVFSVGSKVTVTVDGVAQVSGETENDYSEPMVYTLTGEDGVSAEYVVSVELMEAADNAEHNSMLGNLGVDTDLGKLEDPNGESVREDYNPLNKKVKSVFRVCEIYATGVTINAMDEMLFDDMSGSFTQMLSAEPDTAWSKNPTKSVSGDFDGDGFEEIAVVILNKSTWALELRIIEDESDEYLRTTMEIATLGDLSELFERTDNNYWSIDIETGDLDGDSKSEILISVADTLFVLDDKDEEYRIIDGHTYTGATTHQYLRIATGDLDIDGKDEFVVVDGEWNGEGTAEYYIYDETTEAVLAQGQVSAEVQGTNHVFIAAEVQIGDMDGDRLPEIAFAGNEWNEGGLLSVLVMDDAKQATPFEFMDVYIHDNNEKDFRLGASAIGDIDGDRKAELVVNEDVYKLEHGELTQPFGNEALPHMHNDILSVGDVTGDFRDDIVFMKQKWEDGVYVYGLNSSHEFVELANFGKPSDGGFTTLTTVNSDFDSAVVEFQEKELLFTQPNIIAALSSPPYHEGIDQNLDDTGTTFGKTKGQEVVSEQSVGFMVGFSIGAEWEAPFGVASASFKTTVETSFDWTSSQLTQIETSIAYTSGPGEDKIVFSTIPFDVYYYKVLSSPEEDQVGEILTINVPRKPQILSVDREFYNGFNGKSADITPEVMGHTIGDVWSYPSAADKDGLISEGGLESDLVSVGAGSGSLMVGISKTEGEGRGNSFDLDVTVEAEFGAGGVTAGVSAGFHYGYSYEVTNTESTFYEGQVGDIPSENYTSDLMYQFGLFTYERSYRGQRFCMVDYWVE